MSYIYKISNKINNKVYIGKTNRTVEKRWREHRRSYNKQRNEKRPLYNAMRLYGIDNFFIETIEQVDYSVVNEREQYWINYYNSYNDGYNATIGGDGSSYLNYELVKKYYDNDNTPMEISKKLNYNVDSVRDILHNLGYTNLREKSNLKHSKNIVMIDPTTNEQIEFISQGKAAEWLMLNNKTTQTNKDNIVGAIGRARNKRSGKAFGYIWL